MKQALRILLLIAVFAAGSFAVIAFERRASPPELEPAAIVVRMREVAQLEVLDVSMYKKVSFAPEPEPQASVWGDLVSWVQHTLNAPKGKAIVFADVHFGIDLSKLTADRIRIRGSKVEVALPQVTVKVELRPGETEVIGSNLDSAQTAKLFELAKDAFQRAAEADLPLKDRARGSAERSLRALLLTVGFREVIFVDGFGAQPVN